MHGNFIQSYMQSKLNIQRKISVNQTKKIATKNKDEYTKYTSKSGKRNA